MDINVALSDTSTPLCAIMHTVGSDKGHPENKGWHNYTTYYYPLFAPIQQKSLRIFELGIGTTNPVIASSMGAKGVPGASLRGWKEFFPHAAIFGADIDKDILFEEDRIKTFYCDQRSPVAIAEMWNTPELVEPFDIIVEDGLHTFAANKCFFECSIHKLAKGGVYIIEDILNPFVPYFRSQVAQWELIFPHLSFRLMQIPFTNKVDNNLLVVCHSQN